MMPGIDVISSVCNDELVHHRGTDGIFINALNITKFRKGGIVFLAWNNTHWIVIAVAATTTLLAGGHALLHKREPRAALLWIVVSILLPFVGPLLYLLFGINRSWKRIRRLGEKNKSSLVVVPDRATTAHSGLSQIAHIRLGSAVTGLPLLPDNLVTPLANGEQAYPAMLDAIRSARSWIYLCTYIFEHREIGADFITALAEAKKRGVEVYVLLDGVGAWYSLNRTSRILKKHSVRVRTFLPPRLFPPELEINLRNHRKVLLVDGETGFTGGMNIRQCHLVSSAGIEKATRDYMFELKGGILEQMARVVEEDWLFVSGEKLPQRTFPVNLAGTMNCRTVIDGPGIHLNAITNLLVGAFSMAEQRITIVTPYFLPPPELLAALQAAALRGVDVRVLLPSTSNLRYVDWATQKMLPDLIDYNIRFFWQPPPFDHSKLLVIDGHYSLIGSSNLDTRSLRLNFELVVEVYDAALGQHLEHDIAQLQAASEEIGADELRRKPIHKRIAYAIWWLFTPYL